MGKPSMQARLIDSWLRYCVRNGERAFDGNYAYETFRVAYRAGFRAAKRPAKAAGRKRKG